MLKTLRLPLVALFFAVVLLGIALYIRFAEDESDPQEPEDNSTQAVVGNTEGTDDTPTNAPDSTPPPTPTPAPTVEVVNARIQPVPGQLTEALVGNIQKLNPLFVNYNPVDRDITSLIFEGLTTINEFGETIPDLAESWEVSRDGLEYVFLIREDILWQDGIPFTSADVRYTIDVMRDPDFPGDPSLTQFWRTVEMSVIDEYTIRFRLVQPLASFPEQLRIGMLPLHVLEGYPIAQLDQHPFNLNPIGTGPYQKEELFASRGQFAISLRVAPVYRQRPEGQTGFAIDRILFRTYPSLDQAIDAFARGEVNSIGDVPPDRLESLNSLNLSAKTTLEPTVGVLIFNWQRDGIAYVQNQRARLAFARGIDRVSAVQTTMGGVALPAESPLIPRSWAYDSNVHFPSYDLQLARSTLEGVSFEAVEPESTDEASEEGTSEDNETPTEETNEDTETTEDTDEDSGAETTTVSEPIRRNLTILVLDDPRKVALAQTIADQWSQLDFDVTVEPADLATYRQRLADGDFDSAIVEYSYEPYADPDPYAFWHVSQYEDGSNYGGMRDLRISEVIEQARRETVGINRKIWYDNFQRLFVTRVPALTLYHPLYSYVVDAHLANVQIGFISSPADRFRTIQNWTWELE